jgi:phenol hydroxylase P0 protein
MSKPLLQTNNSKTDSSFERLVKYVRIHSKPDAQFVEFDFAIGVPELFVELVLPRLAFDAFCESNSVVHMSNEQIAIVDAESEKWRYGENTLMANNHLRSPS